MTHSESISNIAAALASAQGALEAAKRNVANLFFDSKYADMASVIEALKAAFPVNGLSYSQFPCTCEAGIGVETLLMHKSGEWIKGDPFYLPAKKADAQGLGSALTYARRYSLLAATGAWAEQDDDDAAVASATKGKPITAAQTAKDELQAMSPEEQDFIRSHAAEVQKLFTNKGDVFGYVEAQRLDHEETLALWSLLPSNIRSAIKRAKAEMQPAKEAA